MGTYHSKPHVVALQGDSGDAALDLPEHVVVALHELAGACKEGLLALAVGTGMQVMQSLFEEEVTAIAGPKGKHNPERTAVRHGSEAGGVTLGGRRVAVQRPRVRTADGAQEVSVPAYDAFAGRDQLSRMALERMLAGLSTRRYATGLEPVGSAIEERASGTSKSAVSRRFVQLTRTALEELMTRRLEDLDILVLLVDGVRVADHLCVVALAIDGDGQKHPVGLVQGATENGTVVRHLLEDLVARGLRFDGGLLVVIDGSKALRSAVTMVFGRHALVQRCQEHKYRNVTDHLPKEQQGFVGRKLRAAYGLSDAAAAHRELEALARHLDGIHPGAAASLREGLEETLTVQRLHLGPQLTRVLRSTNPIESMIGRGRHVAHNVTRYRDGEMALRWTAAGMSEARKSFRRIKGHRELGLLRAALHAHVAAEIDQNRRIA
ncbi:MAG: IS256 family transposase [Stellaceae bacterium]